VIDRATYEDPALPSEGIRHVLVNGGFALRDGVPTGDRHGRTLLRKRDMPSRPASADTRSLTVRGSAGLRIGGSILDSGGASASGDAGGESFSVTIDLDQRASAGAATGTLRARLPGGLSIEADELGILQTMDRWASVTAIARLRPSGERRAMLAIVDAGDPERRDDRASLRIVVDGLVEAAGTIPRADVRIRR
jgi:hypothetical protein